MEVRFLPFAQTELDDAFDWYEKQATGLGYELLDALNDTLRLDGLSDTVFSIDRCGTGKAYLQG